MPPAIRNSSLQAHYAAAQEAARVGGALHVSRKGRLSVEGRSWLGRQVLRFKQRFFPGHVRAQNMKMLDHLANRIQSDLHLRGVNSYMHQRHDHLAGQAGQTRLLAGHIAETLEQYDHVAGRGRFASDLAGKSFDALIGPRARFKMAFAARNPAQGEAAEFFTRLGIDKLLPEVQGMKGQYKRFMAQLAETPGLETGSLPVSGAGPQRSCHTIEGDFTHAFHKAAMLAMVYREGLINKNELLRMKDRGASNAEMNWLFRQYDAMMEAEGR